MGIITNSRNRHGHHADTQIGPTHAYIVLQALDREDAYIVLQALDREDARRRRRRRRHAADADGFQRQATRSSRSSSRSSLVLTVADAHDQHVSARQIFAAFKVRRMPETPRKGITAGDLWDIFVVELPLCLHEGTGLGQLMWAS